MTPTLQQEFNQTVKQYCTELLLGKPETGTTLYAYLNNFHQRLQRELKTTEKIWELFATMLLLNGLLEKNNKTPKVYGAKTEKLKKEIQTLKKQLPALLKQAEQEL